MLIIVALIVVLLICVIYLYYHNDEGFRWRYSMSGRIITKHKVIGSNSIGNVVHISGNRPYRAGAVVISGGKQVAKIVHSTKNKQGNLVIYTNKPIRARHIVIQSIG